MTRLVLISTAVIGAGVLLSVGVSAALRPEPPIHGISNDPAVGAILGRACQDCHSEHTSWPWYAHLPAVGAAIRKDVIAGRAQMDLSRWASYPASQKDEVLAEIAALVRNRQMPPTRYTLLHPSARLSPEDIRHLTEWTLAERRELRAAK